MLTAFVQRRAVAIDSTRGHKVSSLAIATAVNGWMYISDDRVIDRFGATHPSEIRARHSTLRGISPDG